MIIDGDIYNSLKIFPDASMCKLARLCRVDCRNVSFLLCQSHEPYSSRPRTGRCTIIDSICFPTGTHLFPGIKTMRSVHER